jgi:hypothetical protein
MLKRTQILGSPRASGISELALGWWLEASRHDDGGMLMEGWEQGFKKSFSHRKHVKSFDFSDLLIGFSSKTVC